MHYSFKKVSPGRLSFCFLAECSLYQYPYVCPHYIGSVEFSEEDQIFYGKVLGIHSLISYEGESAKELIQDFHEAVDDYLELCAGK